MDADDPTTRSEVDLAGLARTATRAVEGLWNPSTGGFWRNTEQRDRDQNTPRATEFTPTVTFKSVDAVRELMGTRPDWSSPHLVTLVRDKWVPECFARDLKDIHSTLDPGAESLNPFTLSIYVECLARIASATESKEGLSAATLERLSVAGTLLASHEQWKRPLGSIHPFLLYHAARALRLVTPHMAQSEGAETRCEELCAALRSAVETLLSRVPLGRLAPSDAVALAFCAAGLADGGRQSDDQYIRASLEVVCRAQDPSGCWPLGRVVGPNKDIGSSRLEISTYEITYAVAQGVLGLLRGQRRGADVPSGASQALRRAEAYVAASIVRMPEGTLPAEGWCADHQYGQAMVESWTSATVIEALTALADVRDEVAQREVLAGFPSLDPKAADWPWPAWPEFVEASEPDQAFPVLAYLDRHFVQPILDSPTQLPSAKAGTVSCLLFGPPGTGKTTMVKAMGQGLGWPIITLSPGYFIERGLELIEAQAATVFAQLSRLSRVVVIFDECDELFRERTPIGGTEQIRGITAFVTASMLPKLQELHDRGRIVFVISTNSFSSVDSAVKRGGRIDHVIAVGPPDLGARRRILASGQTRSPVTQDVAITEAAVERLSTLSERFSRSELLRASELMWRRAPWASTAAAEAAAATTVEEFKPSLVIDEGTFAAFENEKSLYSHVVLEGAGS